MDGSIETATVTGDRLNRSRKSFTPANPVTSTHGLRRNCVGFAMLTHIPQAIAAKNAIDNLGAIHLLDATVGELGRMVVRSTRKHDELFGGAVDKRYAFGKGAQPVLSLAWRAPLRILAEEERWRVAAIDLDHNPPIDRTFERAWSVAGDVSLARGSAGALDESWRDADEFYYRLNENPPYTGVIQTDLSGFARGLP
jgi:hypothetical protein